MARAFKIAAAICAVVLVPALWIGSCTFRIEKVRRGFSRVEAGQTKETVVELMGGASEVRGCAFPVEGGNEEAPRTCFELHTYTGIYENWALAFDRDGKVVDKYYRFLGEYGKRPPGRGAPKDEFRDAEFFY